MRMPVPPISLAQRNSRRRWQREILPSSWDALAPCERAKTSSSAYWPTACKCNAMSSTITEPLASTMDEPLARLVAFEPTTFPVLSVYLNTQPDQHGRPPDPAPYLHREFKALARTWAPSSPERSSFDRDVERIVSYATDKIDSAANGVAIFACWGVDEFFEAIQLNTPLNI